MGWLWHHELTVSMLETKVAVPLIGKGKREWKAVSFLFLRIDTDCAHITSALHIIAVDLVYESGLTQERLENMTSSQRPCTNWNGRKTGKSWLYYYKEKKEIIKKKFVEAISRLYHIWVHSLWCCFFHWMTFLSGVTLIFKAANSFCSIIFHVIHYHLKEWRES